MLSNLFSRVRTDGLKVEEKGCGKCFEHIRVPQLRLHRRRTPVLWYLSATTAAGDDFEVVNMTMMEDSLQDGVTIRNS